MWDKAEAALTDALNSTGQAWEVRTAGADLCCMLCVQHWLVVLVMGRTPVRNSSARDLKRCALPLS